MASPTTGAAVFSSHPVEWRIPIGCDFSGFFVEVALGFIPVLRPRVSSLYLLQTRCPDSFLAQLPADEAHAYLSAQVADHDRTASETAGSIVIEHGNPCLMRQFPLRPLHVVARLMSEGMLPLDQLRCAEAADEIWVPTQWHRDLFEAQGLPPARLSVVPEFVDTQLFRPRAAAAARRRGRRGGATFLSVFKWERRKGWDVLLEAYWREFRRSEGTLLRLRTYKPAWEPGPEDIVEWLRSFARQRLGSSPGALARVEVVEELSREGLAEEYRGADAFVLASRGEGWCLPCVEAMASGLPTLTTNYSGPAAYLTEENSFPIRIAGTDGNRQAEPDGDHLRQQMRRVATDSALAEAVGARARADVVERFSARRVGDVVVERLAAAVAAKQPRRGLGEKLEL
mmetsp:Transcript_9859/g.32744  ORF Transcript_9859/g.32744 Transcript_9859/m.32744 type:complete len:399 (+) Transcript_9859:108-1304(+)